MKKETMVKRDNFTGFTQRTCENVDISIYIEYILAALSRFAKYMFWI